MKEWKDKSDADGRVQSSEIKFGYFSIQIHRHISYEKDDWLFSCYPFFSQRFLIKMDLAAAKIMAKYEVRRLIDNAINEMDEQ